LNWNNGPGGSSYYPGGGINWNRPHGIGGSSYFPGGYYHNRHHRPGGRFGHRGKRSAQPQWWSSNSNYKPNHNNGGGLNWNNGPGGSSYYPGGGIDWNRPHGNGIGGSSNYPGGLSQYRPGGSSQTRGKRSPENAPNWYSSSAYKPNYNDQDLDWNNNYNDGLNWNQNNNFGGEICYSDSHCSGRQKCCNRKCTYPAY